MPNKDSHIALDLTTFSHLSIVDIIVVVLLIYLELASFI